MIYFKHTFTNIEIKTRVLYILTPFVLGISFGILSPPFRQGFNLKYHEALKFVMVFFCFDRPRIYRTLFTASKL